MEGKILAETSSSLKVLCGSEGQRGMGSFLKSGAGVDNRRDAVDKVLGLLQCVCQRSLYEMIASVGSEWRLPCEISM